MDSMLILGTGNLLQVDRETWQGTIKAEDGSYHEFAPRKTDAEALRDLQGFAARNGLALRIERHALRKSAHDAFEHVHATTVSREQWESEQAREEAARSLYQANARIRQRNDESMDRWFQLNRGVRPGVRS